MRFDFIVGNPPNTGKSYLDFMEESYKVSGKVLLVTPAKFLSGDGNGDRRVKRLTSDEHIKVCDIERDSRTFFPTAQLQGGAAITYRDRDKTFPKYVEVPELEGIKEKVVGSDGFIPITEIMGASSEYHVSLKFLDDYPDLEARMYHGLNFAPDVFLTEKPEYGNYLGVCGTENGISCYKYIRSDYVMPIKAQGSWKVFATRFCRASFGAEFSKLTVEPPGVVHTVSFNAFNGFFSIVEAENCRKYLKTNFARALHDILKVTTNSSVWTYSYVPLQDFSVKSDIKWSLSVQELDQIFYNKYGFTQEERQYIDSHMQELRW